MITETLHIENILRNGNGSGPPTELASNGWNDTGFDFANGHIIRLATENTTELVPNAVRITSAEQKPSGICTGSVLNGTSGVYKTYGRYVSTLDTTSKVAGDPVFCSSSGALTLDMTPWVVGYVLETVASNAPVFLDFIGSAGFRVRS